MLHLLDTGNTPPQTFPTSSQNFPTAVIIVVAVVSIMILLVIITLLGVAVGLILKRKKQPPTEQCEQIYEEVDDIGKADQVYEELDVRKMDPSDDVVMNKRCYPELDAIERSGNVIGGEDYEELDPKMLDETTNYASLK